jgi:hypothetical protein
MHTLARQEPSMKSTENMMWAGPLLPVGLDPTSNLKPNEQLPLERLASKKTLASERRPATSADSGEPMTCNGPLSPDQLE